MIVTNETGLPKPLWLALQADGYTRGDADISVTSLISPPRQVALQECHADVLMDDAADQARKLIGTAVHKMIAEKSDGIFDDNVRLFMDILGWRVSGQTDNVVFDGDGAITITDYKTPGVNEYKFGIRKEREQQANCYAHLLRHAGYQVEALKACLIFVDFKPMRAEYEKNYPERSIVTVDLPLWPAEQAQAFMEERVRAHQEARKVLPLCTDEERWGESKWAVTKDGLVRAFRVVDSKQEAEDIADEKGADYYVEERVGESMRCRWYCNVSFACTQWQEEGRRP